MKLNFANHRKVRTVGLTYVRLQMNCFVVTVIAFISLLDYCKCHSFLVTPAPISTWCKGCLSCRNVKRSDLSQSNVDKTWKRGEPVDIKWVRNNHHGGFVRFSIVPLKMVYDEIAHKRFAFYYGCWEQGLFLCGKNKKCGTDQHGMGFQRKISVPDVIPDGIYIFTFMWFGGLHYKRKNGRFSHYTSCSLIRIKGGVTLKKQFQKQFEPGDVGKYKKEGLCLTSTAIEGQCLNGCTHISSFYSIPGLFKRKDRKDILIYSSDYDSN